MRRRTATPHPSPASCAPRWRTCGCWRRRRTRRWIRLTTSQQGVLLGSRQPRHRLVPPAATTAGPEAVELAATAGLVLDPWQADVLHGALGEHADGSPAATEVAVIVPRQNGKGSILEAEALYSLFLTPARLLLWSAHEFKTAKEGFLRLVALVTNTDELRRKVKAVRQTTGEEGIELLDGSRVKFVARSRSSGR